MILDSEEKPPSEIVKYTGNHKLSFIYAVKYLQYVYLRYVPDKKEAGSCGSRLGLLVPGVIRHPSEPFHSITYLKS